MKGPHTPQFIIKFPPLSVTSMPIEVWIGPQNILEFQNLRAKSCAAELNSGPSMEGWHHISVWTLRHSISLKRSNLFLAKIYSFVLLIMTNTSSDMPPSRINDVYFCNSKIFLWTFPPSLYWLKSRYEFIFTFGWTVHLIWVHTHNFLFLVEMPIFGLLSLQKRNRSQIQNGWLLVWSLSQETFFPTVLGVMLMKQISYLQVKVALMAAAKSNKIQKAVLVWSCSYWFFSVDDSRLKEQFTVKPVWLKWYLCPFSQLKSSL